MEQKLAETTAQNIALETAQADYDNAESELTTAAANLNKVKEDTGYVAKKEALDNADATYKNAIATCNGLKSELDNALSELDVTENDIVKHNSKINNTREQITNLESGIKDIEAEIVELQTNVITKKAELEAATNDEERATLCKAVKDAELAVESTNETYLTKKAEIKTVTNELTDLEEELTLKKEIQSSQKKEVDSARDSHSLAVNAASSAQSECNSASANFYLIESKISTEMADYDNAAAIKEAAYNNLESIKVLAKNASDAYETVLSDFNAATNTISENIILRNAKQEEITEKTKQLNTKNVKLETDSESLVGLQASYDDVKKAFAIAEVNVESANALKESINSLQAQRTILVEKQVAADMEYIQAKEILKQVHADLDLITTTYNQAKAEYDAEQTKITQEKAKQEAKQEASRREDRFQEVTRIESAKQEASRLEEEKQEETIVDIAIDDPIKQIVVTEDEEVEALKDKVNEEIKEEVAKDDVKETITILNPETSTQMLNETNASPLNSKRRPVAEMTIAIVGGLGLTGVGVWLFLRKSI